jgi:glycerophosphoryl diester phosphodiesterase
MNLPPLHPSQEGNLQPVPQAKLPSSEGPGVGSSAVRSFMNQLHRDCGRPLPFFGRPTKAPEGRRTPRRWRDLPMLCLRFTVPMRFKVVPLLLTLMTALLHHVIAAGALSSSRVRYINELPPETASAREKRHQHISERRAGTIVIVHRGASAFAPENTLEACAAAMDYGADGCEIDIRRTADGVLVLFHDDMLDHLTDGFGTVQQITYYDLLSLSPRFIYGTATRRTRPPTLAALLVLARQRAMLLHLDIKEPGLDDDLIAMLDAADVWDHVVAVNTANAPKLRLHPKLMPLAYKIGGLYEGRRDVDPEAIKAALTRPGQMIMVDDPRVATRELKRAPYRPVRLPPHLQASWRPATAIKSAPTPQGKMPPTLTLSSSDGAREQPDRSSSEALPKAVNPAAHLSLLKSRIDPNSPKDLVALLTASFREGTEPDKDVEYQRRRTERIVERAWAAQRLGQIRHQPTRIIHLLEQQVRTRSLHRDWMYHGLDGAMAVRALEMLGAAESVPVLIETFRRVDPELKRVANPEFSQLPLSWTDFRAKMYIIPALGALGGNLSKQFLLEYLALDEAKARELAPPQFEEAAKALLRQKLNLTELTKLLESQHPGVRGTALLECLDHPTAIRTAALKKLAPWILALPRAK